MVDEIVDLSNAQQQFVTSMLAQPTQLPTGLTIDNFSLDEVIREINKIDIYKASGMPEISSKLIKHAFSNIPIVLQHLFNCSL